MFVASLAPLPVVGPSFGVPAPAVRPIGAWGPAQLDPAILGQLEWAKSRFVTANLERCSYLRVAFGQADNNDLEIVASFTLGPDREWHRVEATIPEAVLAGGKALEKKIDEAFASLSIGVGAVRIARLFCPLSTIKSGAEAGGGVSRPVP